MNRLDFRRISLKLLPLKFSALAKALVRAAGELDRRPRLELLFGPTLGRSETGQAQRRDLLGRRLASGRGFGHYHGQTDPSVHVRHRHAQEDLLLGRRLQRGHERVGEEGVRRLRHGQ